ncbi:phage capsid protein [Clostridia bacterium]|nr:phage capsid protein [Clostridia bacterium]
MTKIIELREKRNSLWNTAKDFLDAKRGADGIVSVEDSAIYDKMEADMVALGREIDRLERQAATDLELSKPTTVPITNAPTKPDSTPKVGRASDEYKAGMLTALRTNFRTISDTLSEGTDASGGYLVPDEMDSRLIDGLTEENILRKLGTTIKTSGEHKINLAGSKPAAAWIEEGGSLTFGDATFAQIVLDAHKLHVAVKVTEELLYDSAFNLESYIINQFTKALGNAEEDAFLNGNGTGKPLGLFAATGGGQIGVTTANATAVTADEIINLVYTLKRPYRKNAAFITNDQTLAMIRKLKDSTSQYIWQPSYQAGEPDRHLGYPIHTSAYVPLVAAATSPLAFGDFSYYNIGDRGTRSFAQLKELFAGNGLLGFLAKERVDGKLVLAEAVQILKMKASA